MRRLGRVAVCAAALFVMAGATPVLAASPGTGDPSSACDLVATQTPKTLEVSGRKLGAKDGIKVDTYQCELLPGSGTVGLEFSEPPQGSITPQIAWGSSYAISTEWWNQLGYDGKAKADANIWSGKRIIQVCMWYTRGGAKVSDTVCSNAASTGGSWLAGPVKTMSVWDSLDPNAPHTIFNFSKVGINP